MVALAECHIYITTKVYCHFYCFLLFTCNAQEQAWEAKHLRPWQTHASQKSQIAPTIAIPNKYETVCENPDHMKTLEIKIFVLP